MRIYVIKAGDAGPVKIGIAVCPRKRLATLQTGNHSALRLVYEMACPEARTAEGIAHRRLSALRIGGEWFAAEESEAIEIVKWAAQEAVSLRDRPPTPQKEKSDNQVLQVNLKFKTASDVAMWKQLRAEHPELTSSGIIRKAMRELDESV